MRSQQLLQCKVMREPLIGLPTIDYQRYKDLFYSMRCTVQSFASPPDTFNHIGLYSHYGR